MSIGEKKYQKALKVKAAGQVLLDAAAPIPQLEDDEVLVRVAAVAINPFDSKSADLSPSIGATVGCDYAGTVIAISSKADTELRVGDRVCGWVFGNNPDRLGNGAFAEYTAAPSDLLMRVPDSMDFEVAATLGVGIATAGMALYHTLRLPWPVTEAGKQKFVLVNGGATATGTLAIQLLRLSGYSPIATCSPRNFETLKKLGCAAAFDYRAPSCADDVIAASGGELELALDCASSTESMKLCYQAIGAAGGRYVSLDPFPLRSHTRRSIKPETIVCLTQFGRALSEPYKRAARPQDRRFAQKWFAHAQQLLADGLLQPHPHRRMGGLNEIAAGMGMVRRGEVAGCKLVYTIAHE